MGRNMRMGTGAIDGVAKFMGFTKGDIQIRIVVYAGHIIRMEEERLK
jgi:hypothetical protein